MRMACVWAYIYVRELYVRELSYQKVKNVMRKNSPIKIAHPKQSSSTIYTCHAVSLFHAPRIQTTDAVRSYHRLPHHQHPRRTMYTLSTPRNVLLMKILLFLQILLWFHPVLREKMCRDDRGLGRILRRQCQRIMYPVPLAFLVFVELWWWWSWCCVGLNSQRWLENTWGTTRWYTMPVMMFVSFYVLDYSWGWCVWLVLSSWCVVSGYMETKTAHSLDFLSLE